MPPAVCPRGVPRLTVASGLALVFLSTACSEEETPSLDSADFVAEERDARCAYLVRCGFATDRDSCRAAHDVSRGFVQAIGAIEFDRVEYDGEAALAYVDLLRDLACDQTLAVAAEVREARAAALEGLVERGESCFADDECTGARGICDQTGCGNQTCCEGTCARVEQLGLGDQCPLIPVGDRLTGACEDTAYCAPPPDDGSGEPPMFGSCQPRGDNGAFCDRNEACLDGQRCDPAGEGSQCYLLSSKGEPCNPVLQNGSCVEVNQVCDMASATCVDAPGDGQPCVFGRCQPVAACVEEVCRRRPGLGESCENTPPCQGDLFCQDGVCNSSSVVFVCVDGDPPPPPEGDGG